MLSAHAYSFRQNSRLAISLSWIGGYTNVVALLSLGTVVSHVTGTTTELGRWLGTGDFRQATFFAFLLIFGIIVHVVSALWIKGSIRAMTRGWVTPGWAWKHHRAWFREVTKQ